MTTEFYTPNYITAQEVAKLLNVTRQTLSLWRRADNKNLKNWTVKYGQIVYDYDEVKDFMLTYTKPHWVK